jgi:transcription elongation factor greA
LPVWYNAPQSFHPRKPPKTAACLFIDFRQPEKRLRRTTMQKIPLTEYGAELLRGELQQLKSVARPEVIAAIAEARSHGDLSENAEYEAAKERQGFIEGRIAEIENKLARALVVKPAEIHAEGKVVFGATVTLSDVDSGDEVRYQIVGDDEADIKHFKISVNSPIARAMIGKEEGDIAEVQAPGGVREYEIVSVEYI